MRIDAIKIGNNPPEDVNVIIEVPIGGEPIKYEMDKEAGTLVVDRFLYTAMRYPGNYGFIPHTLSGDGDPCDVLVANTTHMKAGYLRRNGVASSDKTTASWRIIRHGDFLTIMVIVDDEDAGHDVAP